MGQCYGIQLLAVCDIVHVPDPPPPEGRGQKELYTDQSWMMAKVPMVGSFKQPFQWPAKWCLTADDMVQVPGSSLHSCKWTWSWLMVMASTELQYSVSCPPGARWCMTILILYNQTETLNFPFLPAKWCNPITMQYWTRSLTEEREELQGSCCPFI